MAAKRKQRQPNEDLAATVAEILDNPIVKINLGFLNVGITGGDDLSLDGVHRDTPMGYDLAPMGVELSASGSEFVALPENPTSGVLIDYSRPVGVEKTPLGVGHKISPGDQRNPQPVANMTEGTVVAGFSTSGQADIAEIRSLNRDPRESSTKPTGLEAAGDGSSPMGLDPNSIGTSASRSMFLAEQLGTLFPSARVHRIRLAQDALSHVEEKVYDLLWGPKNQSRDAYRLSEFSLQRIANEGRLNIKTVRELLPRLVEKGFIAIEREADVRRNRPTQYRVWSYGEVLAEQRRRNRFWFVKTGKGVFYARPVSVGVTRDETPPETITPMGRDITPTGGDSPPLGVDSSRDLISELSRCVLNGLGLTPDEPLLRAMVDECRHRARLTDGETATDEEILQFTDMKLRVLRHASTLRNPLAVLRKAVPECFIGQPLVEHRASEEARKRRELEELRQYEALVSDQEEQSRNQSLRLNSWERISSRHRTAQGYDLRAIAEDPELDDQGKNVAIDRMKRLGRFAPRGL